MSLLNTRLFFLFIGIVSHRNAPDTHRVQGIIVITSKITIIAPGMNTPQKIIGAIPCPWVNVQYQWLTFSVSSHLKAQDMGVSMLTPSLIMNQMANILSIQLKIAEH